MGPSYEIRTVVAECFYLVVLVKMVGVVSSWWPGLCCETGLLRWAVSKNVRALCGPASAPTRHTKQQKKLFIISAVSTLTTLNSNFHATSTIRMSGFSRTREAASKAKE